MKIDYELNGDIRIRPDGNTGTMVILEKGKGLRLTEKDGRLVKEDGRVLSVVFAPKKAVTNSK